jgi:hypothetical protein
VVSDVPIDDKASVVTSRISDLPVLNPSEMLIGVGFAYVYSYGCVLLASALYCVNLKNYVYYIAGLQLQRDTPVHRGRKGVN